MYYALSIATVAGINIICVSGLTILTGFFLLPGWKKHDGEQYDKKNPQGDEDSGIDQFLHVKDDDFGSGTHWI